MTSYGGAISELRRSTAAYRSPSKGATRSDMSFREAQQAVDQWVGQFEQGYFTPLANVARLAEEVGELAREVNHQFGPKPKKPDEEAGSIAMELADILFVVICIANSQHIDLVCRLLLEKKNVTSRDAGRWTRKACLPLCRSARRTPADRDPSRRWGRQDPRNSSP